MVEHRPNVVAIIPARGGSKSIPRKNIKPLAGVPLIAYSIAAGLQAETVSRVIVSTDDGDIAAVARQYGADVPFMRPAELAQDLTLDLPVFQHAVEWLRANGDPPDVIVQLRPTTPFRPAEMVDQAVRALLNDASADSVRGVVPSGQNPYKMWKINDDGTMRALLDEGFTEPYNMPRQGLPQTYWQTGHIDAIRPDVIMAGTMSGKKILPLMIEPRFTIDIDTLLDWERAEWMLERLNLPIVRPALQAVQRTGIPTKSGKTFPAVTRLVAFDFDGVMTDNRVWVNRDGVEWVAANRSDGMGIGMLKAKGVECVVISRETDPVVAARCKKLGIECHQGIVGKEPVFTQLVKDRGLDWSQVIYMGNDSNDLGCMKLAGFSAAPADSHPSALSIADWVSRYDGGHGAVRELCDLILEQMEL